MKLTRRQSLGLFAAAASVSPTVARAAPSGVFDAAVIGAGVFGVWIAERLKRAGLSVALVDAYGVGHARASSGGETRVTRYSYGGDPLYSEMARQSLVAWKEISGRTATPIFYNTGVLWFSPAGDAYMAKSLDYLAATKTAAKKFDRKALESAFPQMRFFDGEAGFLEEETGALVAGRGVQTVAALGEFPVVVARAGKPKKKRGVFAPAPGVRAARLIYACGPWLPQIFPDLLDRKIVATRQEVIHFGAPAGDDRFRPGKLPVWADFNAGDLIYGLPDIEGQGFKFCFGGAGPEVDPGTQSRLVDPEAVARAREYLKRRFPDLADAPVVHSRVCQYENTWNSDLLIDRHPDFENVWLAGGGSGHGFKLGPAVGQYVADRIMGAGAEEPRFSLASKQEVEARVFR
jgi:glycine/D-amino acid oxidase-like deaminating enzyme